MYIIDDLTNRHADVQTCQVVSRLLRRCFNISALQCFLSLIRSVKEPLLNAAKDD